MVYTSAKLTGKLGKHCSTRTSMIVYIYLAVAFQLALLQAFSALKKTTYLDASIMQTFGNNYALSGFCVCTVVVNGYTSNYGDSAAVDSTGAHARPNNC